MGLDVRTYGNIKLAENEDDYAFTAFVSNVLAPIFSLILGGLKC